MNQRTVFILIIIVIIVSVGITAVIRFNKSPYVSKESAQITASVNQLLEEASKYEVQGDKLKVKEAYGEIVANYPDYDKVEEIQKKLGDVNLSIITSNIETSQTIIYEVKPGDSLGKLAKQYNTTKELIKKANNLKSDVIRVGEKLRIWTGLFNIMIYKGSNILVLRLGDEIIKNYPISTGVNNSTPVGVYKIATKIIGPVWYRSNGSPIPAESPENPLGSRWMGFDTNPHYGIHGTIDPNKIGQSVSAGCVRMINSDVEELFDIVPQNTEVTIKD